MCLGVSRVPGGQWCAWGSVVCSGVSGVPRGQQCAQGVSTVPGDQWCAWGSAVCLRVSGVLGGQHCAWGSAECPGFCAVPGNQRCAWWAELPALQFAPRLSSPQLMGLPMTQQSSLAPASPPSTFPPGSIPRYLARSSRRSFACLCLAWAFWASAEGKHRQGSAQPHQASIVPMGAQSGAPQPPGTHLAWAGGWRQGTVRGGCSGGSRPLRARLWHPGSSWHQEGPPRWQLGLGAGSRGAGSPPSTGQQRGWGQAGQGGGTAPLPWGAPSQAAWGARGGNGHPGEEHSVPRGPQWQGWGTRAVLAVPRLEGQVGHAAGGCSQTGASQPGGTRADGRGARLQGWARGSSQRE